MLMIIIGKDCRHCDIGWYSVDGLSASTCTKCPEGESTTGIGTAVKITTVGNTIVFTVPGVGTTSLQLF